MKPNHFFKIITFCNIQQNKLEIPRKFIKEQGDNFHDFVLLKIPNGAVWLIELEKSSGDVWLCNGWKRFVDYYSIRPGHLLVFKYKGYSNFNVIILDMSATEIDYPFSADPLRQNIKNVNPKPYIKEEFDEDACVQLSEDSSINDSSKPTQKVKIDRGEGTSATTRGSLGALQRAQAYKSNKPFFIVRMSKTYATGKSGVSVPSSFAKTHISKDGINFVLNVSGMRKWSARCAYQKGTTKCRIFLRSFAKENGVGVGDVCVFELIDHVDPQLKVIIFRAAK